MISDQQKKIIQKLVEHMLPDSYTIFEQLNLSRFLQVEYTSELEELMNGFDHLTERILKTANSAWYTDEPATTLSECFLKLGSKDFFSSVLSAAINEAVGDEQKSRAMWIHIDLCSRFAEFLSMRIAPELTEDAFLIGCFHDMGVGLCEARLENYRYFAREALLNDPGIPAFEKKAYSINHCYLSAELARRWGFSPLVQNVVAHHHDRNDANLGGHREYKHLCVHVLCEYLYQISSSPYDPVPNESLDDILDWCAPVLEIQKGALKKILDDILEMQAMRQSMAI